MTLEEIEKLLETEKDGKEVNNWKFGIELEYGGHDNAISYDVNDENNIIETIKRDGSVAGDGTEYNLIPLSFKQLKQKNKKTIKAIEAFCFRVANKRCTLSKTAGMHIHFSWDKEYDKEEGREFGRILFDSSDALFTNNFYHYIQEKSVGEYTDRKLFKRPIEAFDWLNADGNKMMPWALKRIKSLYEAFQFIYSVSNRDGTEHYGLGNGYTRGYSHHKTLELRCWRTSYDFREIIARVFVARFFLRYILRLGLYTNCQYYDEINNMKSIWEEINAPENEKLKAMYEYLAYNSHNKHKMGLPLHMLMTKLGTYDEMYATEIKRRSDIYDRALKKKTNAKKAKETFETIINFEEKGEQDESEL